MISGPREENWRAGVECVKVTGSGRGSKRGAGGHAVRRLGVISGPREED